MDYRFEVSTTTVDGKKQYVVRYLDFSNLIGVGDTIEEAIKEAEGNLDFYIEYCKDSNIKIPNPTKVDDMDFSGKVTLRMSKDIHCSPSRYARGRLLQEPWASARRPCSQDG